MEDRSKPSAERPRWGEFMANRLIHPRAVQDSHSRYPTRGRPPDTPNTRQSAASGRRAQMRCLVHQQYSGPSTADDGVMCINGAGRIGCGGTCEIGGRRHRRRQDNAARGLGGA